MPYLKKEELYHHNEVGQFGIHIKVYVNNCGEFYCPVPERLETVLEPFYNNHGLLVQTRKNSDKCNVYAESLESLKEGLYRVMADVFNPSVTEEHVIIYNIDSHVSFAVDDNNEVKPNCYYPNTKWPSEDRELYGGHHAANPSIGGYSLCVGARAKTKITHAYGETKKVKYIDYYKDGGHLGTENPAQKLNSWTSISLNPKKSKEIPYTDEAALFFHELLMGMAKISKLIQENTHTEEKMLALISSGNSLLGYEATTQNEDMKC